MAVGGLCLALLAEPAAAFCGFYVSKADTKLYNQASKVVLVRSGDKTVVTMANDFQGNPKEFAIVIPVPTFLEREQIHVTDNAIIDHLDAYTAPRLVEYFDENPCQPRRSVLESLGYLTKSPAPRAAPVADRAAALGVTIEATYTVGEYDILILSAEESAGLQTWLTENDYKVPEGATAVLNSYIRQDMRFFVAKVNLEKQSKLGYTYLRPLAVAFESPKFMLPIRLGTVNAKDTQDLFVFALTQKGRVETTNYRTVKMPSGSEIPLYVKEEFSEFYKAMFDTQVKKEDMRAVFLEYAWNMNWCDPCAADPLSREELRELGVFWLDETAQRTQAQQVFVTRLHVRYDAEHFPEDLFFHETGDTSNFQGRYVLRHPWKGEASCSAGQEYLKSLDARFDKEAQTLASLTGWGIADIRIKMASGGQSIAQPTPNANPTWWQRLWK
jgi:hypothetical protein